jgi:glutathione S-transferase
MRLFYSATSPYARKIRIVIAQKDLEDAVELLTCNAFADPVSLREANPLGKVPALVLDDGRTLYDSPLIGEYLDAQPSDRPALIPPVGAARWEILRQQALGDGILDAAFSLVVEMRRPEDQQSPYWKARWQSAIERALLVMECDSSGFNDTVTLGQISFACALGYLDFRLPAIDWRAIAPDTAHWDAGFSKRPSMLQTAPRE